ncbi:hypothetical protein P5663_06875 [Priestia flexa]|uniref:hypothetical protein n=1 Tax=Priestia flexa TaxID=86664 RepID=UPI00240D7C12|nr:hypothetical protein [Priestia flexa]WEZ09562.1 hypothetical protein P5663_06875 [Priestia flexa]
MKRKQLSIKEYHLNNVVIEDDKVIINNEGRTIEHFHNFFIKSIENILQSDITNDTYFILKFDGIEGDEEKLALYERILREGIYLNNKKYIKSVKSPSMVRTQKTLFIIEGISEKVLEYVSLGKKPEKTVVSKLESAYGISLSSILTVNKLPKIVFVKDFNKTIREDVEVIRDVPVNQLELAKMEAEIEEDKLLEEKWNERKITDEQLAKLPMYDSKNAIDIKSKSQWYKSHRKILIDEIDKPEGHGEYKGKKYPMYGIDQTKKIEFPKINKDTIGKELHYLENHKVPMTMFDGQALGSFEWFNEVSKELGLKYTTNALQGRLPYFKGLIVRFDFKKWCKDNDVTTIIDLFGKSHNIDDIDIIATESCWKVFQDYTNGKKESLFTSIDDWYEALDKYQFNEFGIANYAKSEKKYGQFAKLNYQFIYALPNLTYDDLRSLSKPYEKLLYKVKQGKDISYIKAFLNMLDKSDSEDKFTSKCLKILDIDERMMHDTKVYSFIVNQVKDQLKELCKGRITIRGGYRYLAQDPIAYMEYVAGKEVKGFLDSYEVYKENTEGQHLLMRNPTTSPKEVVKANFINKNNEYVKHLDSVILTSVNDLLLPKFTADVDGDTALFTKEPKLLSAIHENVPLIHEDDKQFATNAKADYSDYNLDSIIEYEKRNTSSMIGTLTNWNTIFMDKALSTGSYNKADLVVSVNKIYQMMLIDAAKTGEKVEIAYPIRINGERFRKPYFMWHIYEGLDNEFDDSKKSALNQYVEFIEEEADKINAVKRIEKDEMYLTGTINTLELLQRKGKTSMKHLKEVIDKLNDIYLDYCVERLKVNAEKEEYEKVAKMKRDPETGKLIRKKYSEIADKYMKLAQKIEPDLSVLATAAVQLAYRDKRNHSFAWDIAYEGIKQNLTYNMSTEKTVIISLGTIDTDYDITGVATVKDNVMRIKQAEVNNKDTLILEKPIIISTNLDDGKYRVFTLMGRHYAIKTVEIDKPKLDEIESYKDDVELSPIINKSVRMIVVGGKAKDVAYDLKSKEFTVKTDREKGFVAVYGNNQYVCSILPESIVKHSIEMSMDGWTLTFDKVDCGFGEGSKSFNCNISIYNSTATAV